MPLGESVQLMDSSFEEARKAIRHFVEQLKREPPSNDGAKKRQSLLDGYFCSLLAMDYYEEANRAVQAKAWFAASSIAAAALEAALLANVLYQEDGVRGLSRWGEIQKKYQGDYARFVRALDLGKLLEIADQLTGSVAQGCQLLS